MMKISVIIPVFNNEKYIGRCVRSVMEQTLNELEIIVVNDGSTDGAPLIINALAKEDDRIKIIHKTNEGYSAAVNDGIEAATAKYIAIVESDDFLNNKMYEKLYEKAEETSADIVKCGFYYWQESKNEKEYCKFYKLVENGDIFKAKDRPDIFRFHACIWAGMYNREFLNEHNLRFIETPKATYSDYSWMTMTYAYAERISIVNAPLYYYVYDNPASSHFMYGDQYKYKFVHAIESNKILRSAGIFDDVKEYIAEQSFNNGLSAARCVSFDNREDCFRLFQEFCIDMFDTDFKYSLFGRKKRLLAQLIEKGCINEFYDLLFLEYIFFDLSDLFEKKIILFGAGKCGISYRIFLKQMCFNVVGWVDNRPEKSLGVDDPKSILRHEFDVILIAVVRKEAADEIKEQLVGMGISSDKIIWKYPLQLR